MERARATRETRPVKAIRLLPPLTAAGWLGGTRAVYTEQVWGMKNRLNL